ncbi:class I lanthipeptide [Pedobacter sp. CFBP9032]|uniref:class I lanthipeptide n=1 Tax=Pedobacter sp. CFBP9032 TaxID=3096539 RepID=UPI002A6B6894|nr:class I lanthipeptide [Pedobacter sp. CFBP9032]MDY0905135.1 class I lanthipeptide [Pedobacter sp. CFBP9032]
MKNQFLKKLSLNKETLVSLQDRQMQAVLGGQAQFYSSGDTSGCPSADCNDSCCKKSCKKAEEPVETVNP